LVHCHTVAPSPGHPASAQVPDCRAAPALSELAHSFVLYSRPGRSKFGPPLCVGMRPARFVPHCCHRRSAARRVTPRPGTNDEGRLNRLNVSDHPQAKRSRTEAEKPSSRSRREYSRIRSYEPACCPVAHASSNR
jgi:hypothetical protein